jgi:hypothetical protein
MTIEALEDQAESISEILKAAMIQEKGYRNQPAGNTVKSSLIQDS